MDKTARKRGNRCLVKEELIANVNNVGIYVPSVIYAGDFDRLLGIREDKCEGAAFPVSEI